MSGRQAKKGEYNRVRRILVSIIHNLGDAVMATAALELVRRRFPEAAIDVLARQGVGELFAGHPLVRRAYSYDARKVLQKVWKASGKQCGKYLAQVMVIMEPVKLFV